MKQAHLAIIGCGDLGIRVGQRWLSVDGRVLAMRRNTQALPTSFERRAADYTAPNGLSALAGEQPDICLFTPLPSQRDVEGYRVGFREAAMRVVSEPGVAKSQLAILLSSTRVYAENNGADVDETSALTTSDEAAQHIIAAEQAFIEHCANPCIVRAAGLYGDGEGMLLGRVRQGVASADPQRLTNRIHRDDLARLIVFLSQRALAGKTVPAIINAVDDNPAPIGEVEGWLAEQVGVTLAPGADESIQRTRPLNNRAICNAQLKAIGFELDYPNFRAGYSAALAESQT